MAPPLCRIRSASPQVRLLLDIAFLPIGPLCLERRRLVVQEARKLRSLLRSRQLVVGPMLAELRAAELEALATSCAQRRLVGRDVLRILSALCSGFLFMHPSIDLSCVIHQSVTPAFVVTKGEAFPFSSSLALCVL